MSNVSVAKSSPFKQIMKKVFRIIGIVIAVLAILAVCAYFLFLRYPKLKADPAVGKWYRVADSAMKDSEGNSYHALFKKGSENKVMIYFAGGGVSINEEMARDDTYNTHMVWPDMLANVTMNMGGLASDVEGSPFKDWTIQRQVIRCQLIGNLRGRLPDIDRHIMPIRIAQQ